MTKIFPGGIAVADDCGLFTLSNAGGMTVTISQSGAALRSWRAPDRYGRMADVLLADADRRRPDGLRALSWQGRQAAGGVSLMAAAGGAGGDAADLLVNYRLEDDGSLFIDYTAMAVLPTLLGVMSNPCFNLNGGIADIGDHMLQIDSDYFVEIDAGGAPTAVAAVGGTPFDLRRPAPIGPRLRWTDSQMDLAGGFDHCFFVRNHYAGGQGELREVARVVDPGSGRRLEIHTTEAAVQFCAGQRAAGVPEIGTGSSKGRSGFYLEANAHPELMNAAWPDIMLHPGQVYHQTTVYRLSLQNERPAHPMSFND